MKKLLLVMVCAMSLLLTSCMGTQSSAYVSDGTQTNVVLSQDNYKIINKVSGQTEATYVLGIGGLSKKALQNNSRTEMFNNANLKDNQAIINISTSISSKLILGPIYMKEIATTTGTVIEFTE